MRRVLAAAAVAVTGLAACAGILGLRDGEPHPFEHRAHVLAGVSCSECHPKVIEAGDEGPLHLPADSDCLRCHEHPHASGPCQSCHGGPFVAQDAAQSRAHLRFEHRRHAAVTNGNCMRCHAGVAEGEARLRPPMATCFRCHDRERDGRNCAACHVDLSEEGTLPQSHLAHDGDFLREHGTRAASAGDLCASCHGERFCAGCHGIAVPALPARLHFDEPGRASVHRAGFRARHSIEARAQPGLCTTCHSPQTCTTCHEASGRAATLPAGERPLNPHPPGWVSITPGGNEHGRAARRDPASCASCHGGAGEALCVGCHRVGGVGGNPHPPGWSSRLAKTDAPCRLCHTDGL